MASANTFVVKNGLTVGISPVIAANGVWIGSPTNLIGPQGYQGSAGSNGPQGSQGTQGYQGYQGTAGSNGGTGPQGYQGYQGSAGSNGGTGPQGYQGPTGPTGPQGYQGPTGPTGSTGPTGAQGFQGYQGTAGSTGPQGYQGTAGSNGGTGPQGYQGYQGSSGSNGGTGPQGYQGYQGTAGSTGGTGPQGPQGYQGAAGGTGPTGPQGATGPSTAVNATNTTSSFNNYLVGVSSAGSNQTPYVSVTNAVYVNPSTGTLYAVSKSFRIPHPTKEGKLLVYGVLEGPENGVYARGRLVGSNTIDLPDYWETLVDLETTSVTLTPIGKFQKLFVEEIVGNKVTIASEDTQEENINCHYLIVAERKDIAKLVVEE